MFDRSLQNVPYQIQSREIRSDDPAAIQSVFKHAFLNQDAVILQCLGCPADFLSAYQAEGFKQFILTLQQVSAQIQEQDF